MALKCIRRGGADLRSGTHSQKMSRLEVLQKADLSHKLYSACLKDLLAPVSAIRTYWIWLHSPVPAFRFASLALAHSFNSFLWQEN